MVLMQIVLACQSDGYLDTRVIDFGYNTYQSAPLSASLPRQLTTSHFLLLLN